MTCDELVPYLEQTLSQVKEPAIKNRKCGIAWVRILLQCVLFLVVLSIGFFVYMATIHHQESRWAYVIQIEILGGDSGVPLGYSGEWAEWNMLGQKVKEASYLNGRPIREIYFYEKSGRKRGEIKYSKGPSLSAIESRYWFPNGQASELRSVCPHSGLFRVQSWSPAGELLADGYLDGSGKPVRGSFRRRQGNSRGFRVEWYIRGKQVTEEDYKREEAQPPAS